MKYRPDIDGLRALAVIFVILFHCGLKLFPSGFVGVDVFFVISGFLITTIIYNALQNNYFSLLDFYKRRLWRLQPVFICLLTVTSALTLFYYLPDDLIAFAKSARKTSVFVSNVYFEHLTSSYFATNTSQLPLLHTWSLSVEWQCYLILPLLILLVYKICGNERFVRVIYLLTLVALMVTLYTSWSEPDKTYYQWSSRLFEFLIGSCIAISRLKLSLNRYVLELLASGALFILFYIAMSHGIQAGFPNRYAVMLCVATATLIALGTHEPKLVLIRMLSSKTMVFIGLLSYSLYIWHWPILVFIRYQNVNETPMLLMSVLVFIFVIAYLSWKFIEKPGNKAKNIPFIPSVLLLFIIPLFLIHLNDYLIKNNKGFPQRFIETSEIYAQLNQYDSLQRAECLQQKNTEISESCKIGANQPDSKKGLMIGDSFSNHHWRLIEHFAENANVSILAHATAACLTLPGISQYDMFVRNGVYQVCKDQTERYYQMIKENHYDYVIIGENWSGYLGNKIINHLHDERSNELTEQRIAQSLDNALSLIISAGSTPVLITSIPSTHGNPHTCFFEHIKRRRSFIAGECDFFIQPEEQKWFNSLIFTMKRKYSQLIVIDPQSELCPENRCKAEMNGIPVFKDESHIQDYASYLLSIAYLQHHKNPFLS